MATKARLIEIIGDMDKEKEELEREIHSLRIDNAHLIDTANIHIKERQSYNVNDVKYMEGIEAKNFELSNMLQDTQNKLYEYQSGSLIKEVRALKEYIIKKCLDGVIKGEEY